ncbi:hypothetical protein QGM71_15205 [Virgibacillus sp. C22-A2]|uniref:DUF2564 family protein n=1 Tax=Virgibacillus tibetensis TaxID=3042313 RepID=A0ABU6KIA1_9BACI|nr:hypothetical protein [Virgibacillus sp. C22-A2]
MEQTNLHGKLQQISQHIAEAQEAVRLAQGSDPQLLLQAQEQLQQAEKELQQTKDLEGTAATENSQFQQAYEQLHDTRQDIQEAQQNNNGIL